MVVSDENTTTDAAITAKPVSPVPKTPAAATATTSNTTTAPKNSSTVPPIKIETKPGASIYSKPLMLITYDKYVIRFSMTYLWRCPSSTILVPLFRQNFRPEKHLYIGVGTSFFVFDALAQTLEAVKDGDSNLKEVQQKFEITLMDLNETALEKAKDRVLGVVDNYYASQARVKGDRKQPNVEIKVTTITADVLDESLILPGSKLFASSGPSPGNGNGPGFSLGKPRHFTSVSMFNLSHCLPYVPSLHNSGDGQEIKHRTFKLAAECLADDETLTGCTVLGRKYILNAYFPRFLVR